MEPVLFYFAIRSIVIEKVRKSLKFDISTGDYLEIVTCIIFPKMFFAFGCRKGKRLDSNVFRSKNTKHVLESKMQENRLTQSNFSKNCLASSGRGCGNVKN